MRFFMRVFMKVSSGLNPLNILYQTYFIPIMTSSSSSKLFNKPV